MIRFSQRTRWNTEESELALAHRDRLAAELPTADLTASNPTRCGFQYPESWLAPLSNPASLDYNPLPMGAPHARQAVAGYYATHGVSVTPSQVLLTTSTSEAYGYLFKLLCDPGDEILVPLPSYPLFDFLADAEVVRLAPAPLIYDHGWQLDLDSLAKAITPRTRAIVLVHPNNPTGHFTAHAESLALAALCRQHNLALIVDEVFLDYGFGLTAPEDSASFAARALGIPVFVVSGASKICALPQMKAAWILASGSQSTEALTRLEILADTWLSMNAPVQLALPLWLAERDRLQSQIRARISQNLAELDRQLALQSMVNRLLIQGGWYAILRIPALQPDELTARQLLDRGVWVHPGYFFGMEKSGWLVLSLLGPSPDFAIGVQSLLHFTTELGH
jgi:aspartate/methionine/tyrosine aminotransferase